MSGKKMVNLENINILSNMIDNLIDTLEKSEQIDQALRIKMYVASNILEEDKVYVNNLKRSIYLQMKNAKTKEQNEILYGMYQSLKLLKY